MDTITERDPQGRPLPIDPGNHRIPVRFHLYWAGSDIDGAIAGYYYAVTETTATPDPGSTEPPPLPGPKPQDYRYTTKTDTTFIFNVTEGAPDRQHAFFIYAVDNQGKPDPTPARFAFIAVDRFPPTPIFDWAYALGTVWVPQPGGGVAPTPEYKAITDISDPRRVVARDTAAVNASLHFKWHASLGVAGSYVAKYCFKLDEPEFGCYPATTDSVIYNLPGMPVLSPGTKVFTIRAVDGAGGARDSTRRVYLNHAPDTWWSGPDPNDPQLTQVRDGSQAGKVEGDIRYVDLSNVTMQNWPGLSPMSVDSVKILPFDRVKRRTFFEIWNHRLYVHSEGDTVHMNSWVAFFNGGYDKDSKYKVKVSPNDPYLKDPSKIPQIGLANLPVLVPAAENGSPVAFRSVVKIKTDPSGAPSDFVQSFPYPIYDPASVFRLPRIGGYWPMFASGKAYGLARAEDGDGLFEYRIDDPKNWADACDIGHDPDFCQYRDRIMVFYVNKSPFFRYGASGFRPDTTGAANNVFNGHLLDVNFPADDVDPYPADPSLRPQEVGVPAASKVLRYKLSVFGTNTSGRDTSWTYTPSNIDGASPYWYSFPTPPTNPIQLPLYFATGAIRIRVELCDCVDCEHSSGEGRCITRDFDATLSSNPQPSIDHVSPSADRGKAR